MSIKLILFCCFTCCLLNFLPHASAQNTGDGWPPKQWPHDPKNCHHLFSNDFQCNWHIISIKGTMNGIIVANCTGTATKEGPACVSVAMVKTGRDTIRVLYLDNTAHKAGTHVKIAQTKEPELDLIAPFDRDFYMNEDKNNGKPQCRINQYDARILKTTWGTISELPQPSPVAIKK